jgi:hypothetical protein
MPGSIKKLLTVAACLVGFGCIAMGAEQAQAQTSPDVVRSQSQAVDSAVSKGSMKKGKKAKADTQMSTDDQSATKTAKAKKGKSKKAKQPKTEM